MTVTILFLAAAGAIAAWWLWRHRLAARPWLEEGPIGDLPGGTGAPLPAAKVGLGVFLAVVGCLFALFISAYSMRMHMGDWQPLPAPKLLWFNTGLLCASSAALHWAQSAARRGEIGGVRTALLAAGVSTLAFLAGQLLAWQQLAAGGYFIAASPAVAFFYLLTAVHGLHLAGGLVALGRTTVRAWRHFEMRQVRSSVELCAIYWHFLFLVWLILFGLLLLNQNGGGVDG